MLKLYSSEVYPLRQDLREPQTYPLTLAPDASAGVYANPREFLKD